MKKNLLAIVLSFMLVLSLMPSMAIAAEGTVESGGGAEKEYTVNIALGDHMALEGMGEAVLNQTISSGSAISSIDIIADSGYGFPDDYNPSQNNPQSSLEDVGLTVTVAEDNYKITISGIPTADVNITLPPATEREAVPEIKKDFTNEQLINFDSTATYEISGVIKGREEEVLVEHNGQPSLAINEEWFGGLLAKVKKATANTNKLDSILQELSIEDRPEAPSGSKFNIILPTAIGATDGKLEGLTFDYQYRVKLDPSSVAGVVVSNPDEANTGNQMGNGWFTGDGSIITGITDGAIYEIRKKATDTSFASKILELKVKYTQKETQPTGIGIDYTYELLTGFVQGKYMIKVKDSTVEKTVTIASGNNSVDIDKGWFGNKLEIVRTASNEHMADSEPLELDVPPRPEASLNEFIGYELNVVSGTEPFHVTIDWKDNTDNIYNKFEYRIIEQGQPNWTTSWQDITSTTAEKLYKSSWVETRKKATEDSFKSDSEIKGIYVENGRWSFYNARFDFVMRMYQAYVGASDFKFVATIKNLGTEKGIEIVEGNAFANNAYGTPSIIYSGGDPNVAEIDESGKVTIKGVGGTTIYATRTDTNEKVSCYLDVISGGGSPSGGNSGGGSSSGGGGSSSSSGSSSQATQTSNASSGEIAIKTVDATPRIGDSGGGEGQTAVEWKLTSSQADSSGKKQVILSSNQISDLIKAVNQSNANQININMQSSSEENNSSNNNSSNNNENNSGSNTSTTFQTSNSDMKNLAESTDADLMLQSDAGSVQLANEDLNNIASNLSEDGNFSVEMSNSNPTDTPVPGGMQALDVKIGVSSNSNFLSAEKSINAAISNSNFYINNVDIDKLASADSPAVLRLQKSSAQDLGMAAKLSITDVQFSMGQVRGALTEKNKEIVDRVLSQQNEKDPNRIFKKTGDNQISLIPGSLFLNMSTTDDGGTVFYQTDSQGKHMATVIPNEEGKILVILKDSAANTDVKYILSFADSSGNISIDNLRIESMQFPDGFSVTINSDGSQTITDPAKWIIKFPAISNNDAEDQGNNNKEQSLADKIREAQEKLNQAAADEFGIMSLSDF